MEEDKIVFKKNFINFKKEFNFNELANLVDRNQFVSQFTCTTSSFINFSHVLETPIKILNVEKDFFFNDLYTYINTEFNKKSLINNLVLFFSFTGGGKGHFHKDREDVHLIGLYGKTMYIVNNKNFILEKGDLLIIPKGMIHRAIGLEPRIVLSFGVYG